MCCRPLIFLLSFLSIWPMLRIVCPSIYDFDIFILCLTSPQNIILYGYVNVTFNNISTFIVVFSSSSDWFRSTYKRPPIWDCQSFIKILNLCLQLFVGWLMSVLRNLCLFSYSVVQHILCCVFVLFFFVLCTLCYKFLWIVCFDCPFGIL